MNFRTSNAVNHKTGAELRDIILDVLISDPKTRFTESDRSRLSSLTEDELIRVFRPDLERIVSNGTRNAVKQHDSNESYRLRTAAAAAGKPVTCARCVNDTPCRCRSERACICHDRRSVQANASEVPEAPNPFRHLEPTRHVGGDALICSIKSKDGHKCDGKGDFGADCCCSCHEK